MKRSLHDSLRSHAFDAFAGEIEAYVKTFDKAASTST